MSSGGEKLQAEWRRRRKMKTLLTCHRLSPYRCVSVFWVAWNLINQSINQDLRNGEIGNAWWSCNLPAILPSAQSRAQAQDRWS